MAGPGSSCAYARYTDDRPPFALQVTLRHQSFPPLLLSVGMRGLQWDRWTHTSPSSSSSAPPPLAQSCFSLVRSSYSSRSSSSCFSILAEADCFSLMFFPSANFDLSSWWTVSRCCCSDGCVGFRTACD